MKSKLSIIALSLLLVILGSHSCAASEKQSDIDRVDVSISCDQVTNIVTFTLNNDDLTPRWSFDDGESSTEHVVEKFFRFAGTYQVELRLIGPSGISDECKVYDFTLEHDLLGEKYELVWSEEFDGDQLDLDTWHLEQGYIANNELQNYQTSGNHEVSDGTLKIIARKVNDDKEYGSYTSARMISYHGGKSFTYGRIEARIKVPAGVGTWPAFWMLGDAILEGGGWPSCGEIDIMEHVGYDPDKIHATIHYWDNDSQYTSQNKSTSIVSEDEWLVYGVLWTRDSMQFYINEPDNIYATYTSPANRTNWPFDAPHFIILNLAIGGNWGGAQGVDNTMFDATGEVSMEVDYVRAYSILY